MLYLAIGSLFFAITVLAYVLIINRKHRRNLIYLTFVIRITMTNSLNCLPCWIPIKQLIDFISLFMLTAMPVLCIPHLAGSEGT